MPSWYVAGGCGGLVLRYHTRRVRVQAFSRYECCVSSCQMWMGAWAILILRHAVRPGALDAEAISTGDLVSVQSLHAAVHAL